MSETFDPYRKWFGIPPSQQPPHHYRLLGIEVFESDVEIIDTAASQRMSYLQELSGGQYVKESQKLLNEVSSARRCLLDAKKKAEYDADLKQKLAAATPAAASSEASTVKPPPIDRSASTGKSSSSTVETSRNADDSRSIRIATGTPLNKAKSKDDSKSVSFGKSTGKTSKSPAKHKLDVTSENKPATIRKRKRSLSMVVGGLATAIIGLAVVGYFAFNKKPGKPADGNENIVADADSSENAPERVAVVPPNRSVRKPPEPTAGSNETLSPATSSSNVATSQTTGTTASDSTANSTGLIAPTTSTDPLKMFALPTTGAANTPSNATVAAARQPPPKAPDLTVKPDSQAGAMFSSGAVSGPTWPIHFNSLGGSIRDLNGFFRVGDEYHVFYEKLVSNGRRVVWSWGHAVSSDLFVWKELPLMVTLDPKTNPELCEVFVDDANASGLGTADTKPWLAYYVYAPTDAPKTRALGLAYNTDSGASWTLYDKNPVLAGLSPTAGYAQVVRDVASGRNRRLMTLLGEAIQPSKTAPQDPVQSTYHLYQSTDLKNWELMKKFPLKGIESSLELVPLDRDSSKAGEQWMTISGQGHLIFADLIEDKFTMRVDRVYRLSDSAGYFGFRMLDDGDPKNLVHVAGVAGIVPEKIPAALLGLGLPRHLKIQAPAAGGSLMMARAFDPPPAAWQLPAKNWANVDLTTAAPLKVYDCGTSFRFELQLDAEPEATVVVSFGTTELHYDFKNKKQTCGKATAPLTGTAVRLSGVVDNTGRIIELSDSFAGYSGLKMSGDPARAPLAVSMSSGKAKVASLKCIPLDSLGGAAGTAPNASSK